MKLDYSSETPERKLQRIWDESAEVQGTATGIDVAVIGEIDATLREEEV